MAKKKKSYMPDDDMHEHMMDHGHEHMMDHGHEHGNCCEDHEGMKMHHHKMATHKMTMHQMLAHAYVPWQEYERAFPPKEALAKGTLFPELWGVYPIPK